jgi:hypothetical protein
MKRQTADINRSRGHGELSALQAVVDPRVTLQRPVANQLAQLISCLVIWSLRRRLSAPLSCSIMPAWLPDWSGQLSPKT